LWFSLVAFALTACNGDSGVACPQSIPAICCLVYPQPNSVGIPDGQFALVLSLSGTISVSAVGAPQIGVLSVTAVPSPIPSPSASTTPTEVLTAYSVPSLQSNTMYFVSDTVGPATACFSGKELVGSFTTR
jgi:hypothetical protein